jgi:hypothetical protein
MIAYANGMAICYNTKSCFGVGVDDDDLAQWGWQSVAYLQPPYWSDIADARYVTNCRTYFMLNDTSVAMDCEVAPYEICEAPQVMEPVGVSTEGWSAEVECGYMVADAQQFGDEPDASLITPQQARIVASCPSGTDCGVVGFFLRTEMDTTPSLEHTYVPVVESGSSAFAWTPFGVNMPASAYVLKRLLAENMNAITSAGEYGITVPVFSFPSDIIPD